MAPKHSLIAAVRTGLRELANPDKAPDMQAYMKSEMPYLGVQKPARKTVEKAVFAAHVIAEPADWVDTVLTLWRDATYREERYIAIDLSGDRRYAAWQNSGLLPMYDELIVTGAWWDYVDEIANRRIGPLLRAEPLVLKPIMLKWSVDADRWRRRTSIICQLASKAATDTDLLASCIEANVDDPDFFLRKGIGWALREYAKTDPAWVRGFVAAHPGLSGLSKREAMKHL
ncbi:DNA alkylation repair protein [Lentzea sp. NBRC 105346]|uniref:DNA alkylation repair protein n=1 Tax=Lentzea sp. NBRC 105346 TaxID=3032205 RepID=UPI0024A3720B|nr:DNA alkylation repair protein [Lentzea sp. NBRC 105346]GLZ36060.1 DNA alkylation repair protein [Lentzea sp. NBRC 105346]